MVVWRGENNANSLKIVLKQYKFTKRNGMVFKRPEYSLARVDTLHIRKPDHFSFNCFARSKFCQIFYWIWRFYPLHKQTVTSSWSRTSIHKSLLNLVLCKFFSLCKFFHVIFFRFVMTHYCILLFVFMTCCLFHSLRGQFETITSIQDWKLKGNVIQSISSTTLLNCYFECERNLQCFSLNFYPSIGLCELNKLTSLYHPRNLHQHETAVYMEYRQTLDCSDELCNVTAGLRCFIDNKQRICRGNSTAHCRTLH